MKMPIAKLEHWMRDYYFDSELDLGSSGVYPYSFKEVCEVTGLDMAALEEVVFADSQTVGCLPLRQSIADRYGGGDAKNVMIANGSNEALFHILSTLVETGDEVIALDPIYHALDAVPIAKNCRILRWELENNSNFEASLEALESIASAETKAIMVNFPHNPTGVTINQEQQTQLIELARKFDAYLVWDAAFDELVDGPALPNPFLKYDKAISVGTLSKCFGMPGLRVGWCFANSEVIQKCNDLRDYTTLYVSPLVELVATKVIENADVFISKRRLEVVENYKVLKRWVEENKGIVSWSDPKGGCCCLIKIKGVEYMQEFCKELADMHSVMLVPGDVFELPEYARLGYGETASKFSQGLKSLDAFMRHYRARKGQSN